eukprot:5144886-Pyramimonas_sp.AAC.1
MSQSFLTNPTLSSAAASAAAASAAGEVDVPAAAGTSSSGGSAMLNQIRFDLEVARAQDEGDMERE